MIQAVNWINPKNTFLPPFCFLAFSAAKLDTLLPKIKWKINMRHYGLDAGFTLFILPASKFQHLFFSKEHFKETTPKSLFLCFTLFFFLFLEMFTSIPYFFQIYCGFSDIRLCKMPCREYCLRHLFFIIFFLSCISLWVISVQFQAILSYTASNYLVVYPTDWVRGPGGPEGKILGSTYVPSNTWSESWPRVKNFHFSPDLTQPV